MRQRIARACKTCAAAIAGIVGVDELLLVVGLVLITAGLWPVLDAVAFAVPGAVVLWIALPQRSPFVHRSTEDITKKGAR